MSSSAPSRSALSTGSEHRSTGEVSAAKLAFCEGGHSMRQESLFLVDP